MCSCGRQFTTSPVGRFQVFKRANLEQIFKFHLVFVMVGRKACGNNRGADDDDDDDESDDGVYGDLAGDWKNDRKRKRRTGSWYFKAKIKFSLVLA